MSNAAARPQPKAEEFTREQIAVIEEESLQRYRRGVERLFEAQSPEPVTNGEHSHAAILFELFFKYAKKRIRIFCRNLDKRVFDNQALAKEAREAIVRGVEVEIVTQEPPEESLLLTVLKENKITPASAAAGYGAIKLNFAVMDETAVRIEEDRDACKAMAFMYRPSLARRWAHNFDIVTGTPRFQY